MGLKGQNWLEPPRCFHCGKTMRNATDSITKMKSTYLWECTCKKSGSGILCRG